MGGAFNLGATIFSIGAIALIEHHFGHKLAHYRIDIVSWQMATM